MKNILLAIWEAPQKLIALIVILLWKAERVYNSNEIRYYLWNESCGMSLSNFIFLPRSAFPVNQFEIVDSQWHLDYMNHEYGHTLQSQKLGPLYLLVIGIPSGIWNKCFKKYREKNNVSYYSFYTESWADKLGGVKREG